MKLKIYLNNKFSLFKRAALKYKIAQAKALLVNHAIFFSYNKKTHEQEIVVQKQEPLSFTDIIIIITLLGTQISFYARGVLIERVVIATKDY